MSQDYNSTINLPKTDFPMRAGLPKREPEMLEAFFSNDIYGKLMEKNKGKPRFILHDGPPFSNGNLHMGHVLNKCLKDFIIRYKNMSGFQAPYVPGWDNHGMPIESAIIKQNKLDRKKMSIPEFRDACKKFAENFVSIQRDGFKRLGIMGDWDRPYLTMAPEFEAEEVRIFGKMFEKGYIYKGKKPVYWCAQDETALAEAEIEYSDDPCESIYVKFNVIDDLGKLGKYGDLKDIYFVIWTTTTWTIPADQAICLGADIDYVLAKAPNGEIYIIARELLKSVGAAAGIEDFEILDEQKGSFFELMMTQHPLILDRKSVVINGDHVTLDAGTGCVHTAPGHGMDDYMICRQYDLSGKTNIGIIVPVDDDGRMNEQSGGYAGLSVWDANPVIQKDLEACGALLACESIVHQYPHCWRCKSPIVYRATDQWFCSVDAFKDAAVKACGDVRWMPEWGYDRIVAMVRERADWCISRQRHWGLPIPVFYCSDCKKPVCTPETIDSVANIFAEKGSNAWFDLDSAELLPDGFVCPHCGGKRFYKETDTLDGWFDSGSTHIASLEHDNAEDWPASLYLEGADHYRGWFQSSLLTAVAVKGQAPYKAVLTHGWTVDGEGKAMHKSLGNGIAPDEIIPKYGADLLRLWAASSDYRVDMRCSDAIFKQLSDTYLKIRNTARYILGNLNGFDPNDLTPYDELLPIDKWALSRYNKLVEKSIAAFEEYEFHTVVHAIHSFCVIDMSNFYLDILKDRLYCDGVNTISHRSAQTAIYIILNGMVRLLAPILSFTSEEIWAAMPHAKEDDPESILFNQMPSANDANAFTEESAAYWDKILALRTDVNKALEIARGAKTVGKSLDAEVTVFVGKTAEKAFEEIKDEPFEPIFIVSKVNVVYGDGDGYGGEAFPGIKVAVAASTAPKCARCWTHNDEVGSNAEHPELCPRCVAAVTGK